MVLLVCVVDASNMPLTPFTRPNDVA